MTKPAPVFVSRLTNGMIVSTVRIPARDSATGVAYFETAVVCPVRGTSEPLRSHSKGAASVEHDAVCDWAYGRRDKGSKRDDMLARAWD